MGGVRYFEGRLEFLTPAFLRGADQRWCQWRLSSLKGVLRFWLRAALGGFLSSEDLRRAEAAVFGDTSRKSPVILWEVFHKGRSLREDKPYRDIKTLLKRPGIAYLLGPGLRKALCALAPGAWIRIRLGAPEPFFSAALSALWLASTFGGLGARSRRGFGSFVVHHEAGDPSPLSFSPAEGEDYLHFARNGLKEARKQILRMVVTVMGKEALKEVAETLPFPVFKPEWYKIHILPRRPRGSWEEVLEEVGRLWRAFRMGVEDPGNKLFGRGSRSGDYLALVEAFGKNEKQVRLLNPALGLPLNFPGRFKIRTRKGDSPRRGSPVFFSVTRTGEGYQVMVAAFRERFYPEVLLARPDKDKQEKVNKKKREEKGEREIKLEHISETDRALNFIEFLRKHSGK